MKATVIEIFQDKITKEHYSIGQVIDVDNKRLSELEASGVVKAEKVKAEVKKADDVAGETPKKKTAKR